MQDPKERPFRCPTFFESFSSTALLWPRGRAWPVMESSTPSRYFAWLTALAGAIPIDWPTGFVQAGWTAAIAHLRNYCEQRLCDLREEFWCASHNETHDQWMIEYGLPDPCDPFPDLCTKVAAIGGTRCDYYAMIAARAGWTIECLTVDNNCGADAGCAEAGCSEAGPVSRGALIVIRVDLGNSSAYLPPDEGEPLAGLLQAGGTLSCPPDLTGLQCLLDRVVHAHVTIEYVTFN